MPRWLHRKQSQATTSQERDAGMVKRLETSISLAMHSTTTGRGCDNYQKQHSDEHGSTGQLLRLLARLGQKDRSSPWFRSNLGSM